MTKRGKKRTGTDNVDTAQPTEWKKMRKDKHEMLQGGGQTASSFKK